MECVILYRAHNGTVDFVRGEDDNGINIAVYPNRDEAIKDTMTRKLFRAVPFQIVELTDL